MKSLFMRLFTKVCPVVVRCLSIDILDDMKSPDADSCALLTLIKWTQALRHIAHVSGLV